MVEQADGSWSFSVRLSPGVHPYKFIESNGSFDDWTCDHAELIQCDEGYKSPGIPHGLIVVVWA